MKIFVRRLASLAAVLALSAGNLAACAGWDSTPEARMACCADEETCPMHDAALSGSSTSHITSQSQADSCCAASNGHEPGTPTPATALSTTLAMTADPLPAILQAFHSTREGWLALAPLPRSAVPTHVLLSVFLI